jgi:hypothetical protein
MIRMIFSTVRAPHEPALTVESLAISATGRPSIVASRHDSVSGQVRGSHVGEHAVLDERPLVDEQPHPLPGEELALPALASWYFAAPPRSTRARSSAAGGCSGRGLCSCDWTGDTRSTSGTGAEGRGRA